MVLFGSVSICVQYSVSKRSFRKMYHSILNDFQTCLLMFVFKDHLCQSSGNTSLNNFLDFFFYSDILLFMFTTTKCHEFYTNYEY